MSQFSDLVSKPARDMAGYSPVPFPKPATADAESPLVKLDSNENPFGPSPLAIEAMQSATSAASSYPDDDSSELRRRLSCHHTVPLEQVLVTAGSTEMLSLLCHTMLAPGMNAITSELSFVVYAMAAHAAGAELIRTPMRNDGEGFDVDAILAAINDNTRLVFLANPNNPTGTLIDAAAVDAFLAKVPEHVVVVLDEAYYEFALYFAKLRQFEYSRSLEHLRRGAGVVILRTFSKAHGLAGLRIGYGLGPAELLAYCARMRNPFSVSSVAESAALAALDDHNHIERTVSNNASQAEVLLEGLTKLGCRVVTTWANFLYCDLRQDASGLSARLRDEGISVRSLGAWGAPTGIRVTIGTPEQNELLLTAVRKIASLPESP
jgi:histidinol-phosphate aminotransferase